MTNDFYTLECSIIDIRIEIDELGGQLSDMIQAAMETAVDVWAPCEPSAEQVALQTKIDGLQEKHAALMATLESLLQVQ